MLNLVNNSLKALIESESATLRLSLQKSGNEAVITLTDNGPACQPSTPSVSLSPSSAWTKATVPWDWASL